MVITNGDFETGDLTGWTHGEQEDAVVEVGAAYKYSGTYGVRLDSGTIAYGEASIRQSPTIEAGSTLEFYAHIIDLGAGGHISAILDYGEISDEVWSGSSPGDYGKVTVDISDYEGEYQLRFIAWTEGSNRAQVYLDDISITAIPPPPAADFQADVTNGIPPLTVTFTDTSSQSPTSWDWDFGDGSTHGTTQNPSHVYAAGGNYHVTLLATNGAGSDSETKADYIHVVDMYSRIRLNFTEGSHVVVIGETVTGASSGSFGLVKSIVVTSGTWTGGNAVGFMILEGDTAYTNDEQLDGSTAGSHFAHADGTGSAYSLKDISWHATFDIQELFGQADIDRAGYYSYTDAASFQDIILEALDHTGTSQVIFFGFVPDATQILAPANNRTPVKAYTWSWYYAHNPVPEAYVSSLVWDTDHADWYEPSAYVNLIVDSANWAAHFNVNPVYMITVDGWGTTIPYIGFGPWRTDYSISQVLKEMADKLTYIAGTAYDSVNGYEYLFFCPLADLDTYCGAPAKVTFTKPTGAAADPYIIDVHLERRGSEKINRIEVRGVTVEHVLYFDAGITEFTAEDVVVGGTSGTTATIKSVTVLTGSWAGNDAAGYLVLHTDMDGHFEDNETLVADGGAGSGEATADGIEANGETVDHYTGVHDGGTFLGTGLERPITYAEDAPEEYDTEPLIDDYTEALWDLKTGDQNVYNANLELRTDLRLWQKVAFSGYTEIPTDDLRITHIEYDCKCADIVVSITCMNAAYLNTQMKFKKWARDSEIGVIQDCIDDYISRQPQPVVGTVRESIGADLILTTDGTGVVLKARDES